MTTRTRRTQAIAAAAIVTGILFGAGRLVWAEEPMTAAQYAADPAAMRANAAEILVASQKPDNTEHSTLPFIEKFRSIEEAVRQFGRI